MILEAVLSLALSSFDDLELSTNAVSTRSIAKRPVTVEDVATLRTADTLTISRDGILFAVSVRRPNLVKNIYEGTWFVGEVRGGRLTAAGNIGDIVLEKSLSESLETSNSRWSPNGKWIAYRAHRDGQLQLWRSKVDGTLAEQLTHNAGNVIDFDWITNERILFTVGAARHARAELDNNRLRDGYNYDDDIYTFTDFMRPDVVLPVTEKTSTWAVDTDTRKERPASVEEAADLSKLLMGARVGKSRAAGYYSNERITPSYNLRGGATWLEREKPLSQILRVFAETNAGEKVGCERRQCVGYVARVWWAGEYVIFWRRNDISTGLREESFYAWSPNSNKIKQIYRNRDDLLRQCDLANSSVLICIRDTKEQPAHIAAIDVNSGFLKVVADLNPEFQSMEISEARRIEWDTPVFNWNAPGEELSGLYPQKAYGYVLYPANFDKKQKYPMVVEPYVATGFNPEISEQPLQVYAANGFVVLNSAFPFAVDGGARLGPREMKVLYSSNLNFPHLTMLSESTVRAMNVVISRESVDANRVGIGGVSHGSFIPMYMLQKHNLIAATSIASPGWGAHEYYQYTKLGRATRVAVTGDVGYEDWALKPVRSGQEFWRRIDLADHVDSIESPILMQVSAAELPSLVRLIRSLDDAGKPYDAYVFANETHVKWQPAHIYAVLDRNLDWFCFWLQGRENPDPSKWPQYNRWRALKNKHRMH